ncbi:hypothetical protein GQ53DRAFT_223450 [Thozetella sp. PMI_491]|nr:hypothetical protein GQ53DRAFT_223450 [Thozetella sp. PMI_491]
MLPDTQPIHARLVGWIHSCCVYLRHAHRLSFPASYSALCQQLKQPLYHGLLPSSRAPSPPSPPSISPCAPAFPPSPPPSVTPSFSRRVGALICHSICHHRLVNEALCPGKLYLFSRGQSIQPTSTRKERRERGKEVVGIVQQQAGRLCWTNFRQVGGDICGWLGRYPCRVRRAEPGLKEIWGTRFQQVHRAGLSTLGSFTRLS